MSQKLLGRVREFFGACPVKFREMSETYPGTLRGISGKCPGRFRELSGKRPGNVSTPQQYNKKPVKIGQGLDFLKFWGGKPRETIGKSKDNVGKTKKIYGFQGLIL